VCVCVCVCVREREKHNEGFSPTHTVCLNIIHLCYVMTVCPNKKVIYHPCCSHFMKLRTVLTVYGPQ